MSQPSCRRNRTDRTYTTRLRPQEQYINATPDMKMAYYVAALPIIYYGTSYTANQLLNATKEYFCDKVDLVDDSEPVLSAAKQVVRVYKDMEDSHHAYEAKTFIEDGIEMLEYESRRARANFAKWRIMRKDFKRVNKRLRRLTGNLEQRMRLFHQIVNLPSAPSLEKM